MNLINQPLNVFFLLQGRSTCAIEQAHESNDPWLVINYILLFIDYFIFTNFLVDLFYMSTF